MSTDKVQKGKYFLPPVLQNPKTKQDLYRPQL